jgi:hypothetical protein
VGSRALSDVEVEEMRDRNDPTKEENVKEAQSSPKGEGLSVNVLGSTQTDRKGKEFRKVWQADLEDLSSTGVFVSLPESDLYDLEVKAEVGIEMELPGSAGQFRSTGKVVGYKPDEKKQDRVLVAIKLGETSEIDIETSEIDMEKLAAILKKQK